MAYGQRIIAGMFSKLLNGKIFFFLKKIISFLVNVFNQLINLINLQYIQVISFFL